MRTVALVCLTLAAGSAAMARSAVPSSVADPWLARIENRAELEAAIAEHLAIPPSRAIAAIVDLSGVPSPDVDLIGFSLGRGDSRTSGLEYVVRIGPGPGSGLYSVDGLDGIVISYIGDAPLPEGVGSEDETISEAQAELIARTYLREKFPWTVKRRWFEWTAGKRSNGCCWQFGWLEELSPSNARMGFDLYLEVRKADGLVQCIRMPARDWRGPLVPRISRAQAENVVTSRCWSGGDEPLPQLSDVYLAVSHSDSLEWILVEAVPFDPDPESSNDVDFIIHAVDAITGEYSQPMMAPLRVPQRTLTTELPRLTQEQQRIARAAVQEGKVLSRPAPRISLRHGMEAPFTITTLNGASVGQLWVRAEALNTFGAYVFPLRDRLRVWCAERRCGERELGAAFRENCWWVPLRRAAAALGWQVHWDRAKQIATVMTAGSEPRRPRPVVPRP